MLKLTHHQRTRLEETARKFSLPFVILHGSFAREEPREASDLDIAVVRGRRIKPKEFLHIHSDLCEILERDLGGRLDLATLCGADPLFRYFVTCEGILLCGDPTDYEEFKSFAFRDYMDSAYLRKLELHMTRAKQYYLTRRYAE